MLRTEIAMKILYLIAGLCAVQFAGPAMADSFNLDVRQDVVQIMDLDLSKATDIAKLDRRIFKVASSLCQSPSFKDALGQKKFKKCRDEARASATEQRSSKIALAQSQNAIVNTFIR